MKKHKGALSESPFVFSSHTRIRKINKRSFALSLFSVSRRWGQSMGLNEFFNSGSNSRTASEGKSWHWWPLLVIWGNALNSKLSGLLSQLHERREAELRAKREEEERKRRDEKRREEQKRREEEDLYRRKQVWWCHIKKCLCIQMENSLYFYCSNISQYICFCCTFNQINAALVKIRDFFQKNSNVWTVV